jgi:phosphoribosylaminoimidazole carboxylase (NCAIR synthetase)
MSQIMLSQIHHNNNNKIAIHNTTQHNFSTMTQTERKVLPTEPTSLRVGCIGGGQLGRMMALEAPRLNIQMSFLDPLGEACPAAAACGRNSTILKGGLNEEDKIRELAKNCDVVTCEIEHIGTEVLIKMEEEGVNVQPSGKVVKVIQDKYVQKVRVDSMHFECYAMKRLHRI